MSDGRRFLDFENETHVEVRRVGRSRVHPEVGEKLGVAYLDGEIIEIRIV